MIVKERLKFLSDELTTELSEILGYWMKYTFDKTYDGFFGRVDNTNNIITGSPKGSVLNSRILWSFSAAYNFSKNHAYLHYAGRAYHYIKQHFVDREFGGVFWSVNEKGDPLDTKKQVYATAFTIYGLSEFYQTTQKEEAKNLAIEMFHCLVKHSYDIPNTGYLEAFNNKWEPINDLRLSEKDANEKKTMNTHLHVLEAYSRLYEIWPDGELKWHIENLLQNFLHHFINKDTNHLNLFFDEDWHSKSSLISYGHDIEATWLLQKAAEVIGNQAIIEELKIINTNISDATLPGIDNDGGLWYEYNPANGYLIKEKHWWVQAEAMVGFYNTFQITGDEKYLDIVEKSWDFVKTKILDKKNGEWFWGIDEQGKVMPGEDKVGLWKCPYHNSRACMELIKRIKGDQL